MVISTRMRDSLAAEEAKAPHPHDEGDLSQSTLHVFEPAGKNENSDYLIGHSRGGMNMKKRAVKDRNGRPLSLFTRARGISDYVGAAALRNGSSRGPMGAGRLGIQC